MPTVTRSPAGLKNYRVMENIGKQLPEVHCSLDRQIQADDSLLLIRLSAIGDAVRLFPVIAYLRNNDFSGTIGVATQPPTDQLFKHHPGVDNVHTIHKEQIFSNPRLVFDDLRSISAEDYRWCFDCHYILKSAVTSLFSRSEFRIGYSWKNSKEANPLFQNHTVSDLPENLPRILKYISLLRPFTSNYSLERETIYPDLPVFPASKPIKEVGSEKPILLHPATSHSRYGNVKEWGADNFIFLGEKLVEHTQVPIYITWGPGEKQLAQRIAKNTPDGVKISPETSSLKDLAHLIQRSRLIVTGDTAPCHIADTTDTPLVALFGGSNHLVSGPLLTDYRLLVPAKENRASAIPPEKVSRACLDLLSTTQ